MTQPTVAPYGSWKSPIQARQIAEKTVGLSEPMFDGHDVWWVELRPAEAGRYVVVRRAADGSVTEMTPKGYSARTRAHEYGGGAYLPWAGGVCFSNMADQRVYRYDGRGDPVPFTPAGDVRYADFIADAARGRLIAVQEDHRGAGECTNSLAAIDPAAAREPQVLASGRNFYASPRLAPDGRHLAYLAWDHPNMPWDAAELWVAPVRDDGSLGAAEHVAGGPEESVMQPEWSPDGTLYFVSDFNDWWNLYRLEEHRIEPVALMDAEMAAPMWVFRGSTCYAFDGPGRILAACSQDGRWQLMSIDPAARRVATVPTPYQVIGHVRVSGGMAVFVGGAPDRPTAIVRMDPATGRTEELRRSSSLEPDAGYLSMPEAVEYPTEGGRTAHGFFYAPANKDFAGPATERPPLVVMAHGGPTSATGVALRGSIQYYTSRGIAVLDVNYGGSTGYGRKYRNRLDGQWGVVDIDDCCAGAQSLAARGRVDGRRLAITGGSAGGYTTLGCLVFRDVFATGASHFGVSDCEALAKETHKFESRYLDRLIGPYPARRDLYLERSPLFHLEGLKRPVIFFQGMEDKIVPPDQAQRMVEALRAKHLPVAYVEFEGEQHGFRQSPHIIRAIEGELYFFSRIFGFTPADPIPPVEIENLPQAAGG
jgi:dipeptidyl aminopeptidase/acylaminoacyl peptidase